MQLQIDCYATKPQAKAELTADRLLRHKHGVNKKFKADGSYTTRLALRIWNT